MPWHEAFERLANYAQSHPCIPPSPPKPLILAGWAYSNDVEKMQRWEETVAWAEKNGCSDLVCCIPDQDFYFVEKPTSYTIGPLAVRCTARGISKRKAVPPQNRSHNSWTPYCLAGRRSLVTKLEALRVRWHSPEKKHVVSLLSPTLLLPRRGVVGRIFLSRNQSDEPSLSFGRRLTRPLLRMKLTTLISQQTKTPNKAL